jgi:hypothetical protein
VWACYSDVALTDSKYSLRLIRHERSVCPDVQIQQIVRAGKEIDEFACVWFLESIVSWRGNYCIYERNYNRLAYLVQREKGTGNERNTRATNIHGGLWNDINTVSQTIVQALKESSVD